MGNQDAVEHPKMRRKTREKIETKGRRVVSLRLIFSL
jgi:hypothetical protein